MAKILFEVDSRHRANQFDVIQAQAPRRREYGEVSFSIHVDDNARNVCYVFLEWESLRSAHRFLESAASKQLVGEWPVEKVLGAIPLYDLGDQLREIEGGLSNSQPET